jgi:hypothetical protein
MHCPHCGKVVDAGDAHCRHCGGALGTSSAGALDALVEQKARAILAEQRAAEQQQAEEARRRLEAAEGLRRANEAREAAEKERRDSESTLQWARTRRDEVRKTPRRFVTFHRSMLPVALLVAIVVGLPVGCIGECVGKRPMWGSTLCPGVCSDCRGPGVIETWHSSGSGGDSDHMGAYCHNDHVNVDTQEFWLTAVGDKAEDIELPWWKRNGLTVALVAGLVLVLLPFLAARWRRRSLDAEAQMLEARIARLEGQLGASGATPGGTYR